MLTGLVAGWLAVPVAGAQPPPDVVDPFATTTDGEGETGEGETTDGRDVDVEGAFVDDADPQQDRQFQLEWHILVAQRAEKEGRYDDAIREYTQALKYDRGDPEALRGRAESRFKTTRKGRCPRKAVEDLKQLRTYDPKGIWLETRVKLLGWMGLCGARYQSERLSLALEIAEDPPQSDGRPDDIRLLCAELRLAEADRAGSKREIDFLREAALEQYELYRKECKATRRVPRLQALQWLAEYYQNRNDVTRAIEVLRELGKYYPEVAQASNTAGKIADLEVELELRALEKQQGGRPNPEAQAAFERAQAALKAGNDAIAEAELQRAIEASPWFPKAYYVQGLVYARQERYTKAVESLKRAIRMDRFDHQAHITLGLLYKRKFAGAEDEQAIEHLEKALELRPDLPQLRLFLGELYARTNRELARRHYQQFLETVPRDHRDYERARDALGELDYNLSEDEPEFVLEPPTNLRRLDPTLQRMINEAYLRAGDNGDWAKAERILNQALEKFPDEVVVYNELAKVAFADKRPGDARRFWEESLTLQEDQMEVHERLGILLRELPDEALPHLQRAAELGSATGQYLLAELLWEQYRFLEASDALERYLQNASDYEFNWERAVRLRAEMDGFFLKVYIAGGILIVFALSLPAMWIFRRLRGASLSQLLARAPTAFPEVARILSLIRHEILKHNTAFLADVGRALELDEPDAETRVAIVNRRLFGERKPRRSRRARRRALRAVKKRSTRDQGIYGRFLGYVDELQSVARTHGVTLNLYQKDPVFRSMIRAFEDLWVLSELPRTSRDKRASKKLELARVLQRSGHVLGRKAFERLSNIIQALCVVDVDASMVAEVYQHVCAEPLFAGVELASLEVRGEGARIRVFRSDLDDILTNVFRNSLQSSVLYAPKPISLGVDLVIEEDDITGLESLAIRIKDRSTEQLSDEMLRGRYIERGMGITVDLLSRYDGAIAVEPEPDWQKAVVLRFFTVEPEGP